MSRALLKRVAPVALLLPALLVAQEAPQDDGLGETVRVDVVNVDVYVTDKEGLPITGLEKEDFELFVDGRPVAITNFYAVSGETPTEPRQRLSLTDEPEEEPASAVPEDQRLHLIVYVDNYHLEPFTRNRSLAHLRTFIRQNVNPGDQVMLVTHDRSVQVRRPFTSNPEKIAEGLYEIERTSGFETQFLAERQEVLELIYSGKDMQEIWSRVRALSESRRNAMQSTLDDLREYLGVLAGLPGRKVILHVSDGLPMRPAEDVYRAMHEKFDDVSMLMEGLRADMSRDFDDIVRLANTNRITFYTLEAAGLRSQGYTGAESASIAGGTKIDTMHHWNLRSPLIMLAAETGGTAIVGTNNQAPALAAIGRDLSSYYSLGFMPPLADPSYHRIEVKLADRVKGSTVRHREGYRRKDRRAVMTDGMRSALYFGYQRNSMGLDVIVGRGRPGEGEEYSVPVLVDIPIKEISLVPGPDVYRGRLRVFISATDEDGRDADISDIEVPIEIPSDRMEEALQSDYRYELDLRMRGGRQILAIGVEDEIGGTTSLVSKPVDIGS